MEKETQKILLNRLNRAEGQIHALHRMLKEGKTKDCKAFITQVKAARSALKGVSEQYVLAHIHTCQQLPAHERGEQVEKAIKMLAGD